MKILFDGTALQSTREAKYHGGGEYAKYVFFELIKRNINFDLVLDSSRELDKSIAEIILHHFNGEVHYINSQKELTHLINQNKYNIFYSALPYDYQNYNANAKFIGVIHGLRPIELPWDKYKYKFYSSPLKRGLARILGYLPPFIKYWKNKHINNFTKILRIPGASFITVSNHSKYSILNIFPFLKENQIKVFYSPFKLLEGIKDDKHNNKYFILISGNRYEKNIWRAALAFDKLFSDGRLKDYKVVITGSGRKSTWKNLKNQDKFILKDYLDYSELGSLFANAFAFIYPSLNEGFGYPPLYAMALGVPVIASSATSIPEVCGDAALYFNPTSIEDLCCRILMLTDDKALRQNLIKAGEKRVNVLLDLQENTVERMIEELFMI